LRGPNDINAGRGCPVTCGLAARHTVLPAAQVRGPATVRRCRGHGSGSACDPAGARPASEKPAFFPRFSPVQAHAGNHSGTERRRSSAAVGAIRPVIDNMLRSKR
jgi:hypothetical protein